MSNPFVGEIRMFGGNFAPAGWAFCNGATLAIAQNDVLFQLIGTTYGGDGEETFNLPNLQSRIPMHAGTGSSGTTYTLGEQAGVEEVTLTTQQIPIHNHAVLASNSGASQLTPQGGSPAQTVGQVYASNLSPTNLSTKSVSIVGGNQPHTNMQPYLCISFIISLFGLYPPPN